MLILKTHNTKIDTISPTHKFTQIHTIFIHRLTKVFMLSYTSTYMLSPLTTHTVVLFKINIYTGWQSQSVVLVGGQWLMGNHAQKQASRRGGQEWVGFGAGFKPCQMTNPPCLVRPRSLPNRGCKQHLSKLWILGACYEAARLNSSFIQGLVSPRAKLCYQTHPSPCNRQAALGDTAGL